MLKNSNQFLRNLTMLLLATILLASFAWYKLFKDPSVKYLNHNNSAHWIKHNKEFDLGARVNAMTITAFRTTFNLKSHIPSATIVFQSLRSSKFFIDGKMIYESSADEDTWKRENPITIGNLTSGPHELTMLVMNYDGPPLALAYSVDLGFKTDLTWKSSTDGKNWTQVILAEKKQISSFSKKFQSTFSAFAETLYYGIFALVITFIAIIISKQPFLNRYHANYSDRFIPSLRILLMILWTVLVVTSVINHPLSGTDYPDHLAYIHYIINEGSLPTAKDGLQTFQSPLYYLIAAALLKFSLNFTDAETSYQLLKLINLACGLAIVEICYRCVITVFPGNLYLQFIGLITGALFPMNLFMSQYIGNEQLAAAFSALAILLTIKVLKQPDLFSKVKYQLLLGLALGLGLLTKVSVVLLVIPTLGFLAYHFYRVNPDIKNLSRYLARTVTVIILVSGWYYLRNWILLGKPFIGGWDPEGGVAWWQDPGYRIFEQFTTFGASLVYPIYAASTGFWDAFYSMFWVDATLGGNISYAARPLWNYSFMLSLPLLSLLPSLAIVLGIIVIIKKGNTTNNRLFLYSVACFCIYFFAILYLYLLVPIYGSGKPVYAMGLIPVFAILCAKGFGVLTNIKNLIVVRAIFTGLFVWWASFSYISFFTIEYQNRFSQFYLPW